jgi:hypothetical protein
MALICHWAEVTLVSMVISPLQRGLVPIWYVWPQWEQEASLFEMLPNLELTPG